MRMKQISYHVLSVFLLVAGCTATYAQLPPRIQKVTTVEGITEYRLDNGLRVLLFPDPSKPTITVNVTVLVGSGSEGYGEKGMAHLLEHLVFKGTPGHPDIPRELTEHGTRPNGTTSFDRTNYFETFQATEENLKWALDMEADRLVNSFIAKKDLDSEMTVVRNEWEAGENFPQAVLQKRILAAAYEWHNYGHTVIGARSDIEKVPIERLQEFYRKHYQTDNAILMVAGKIDEPTTLKLINASGDSSTSSPISENAASIYTSVQPIGMALSSPTMRKVEMRSQDVPSPHPNSFARSPVTVSGAIDCTTRRCSSPNWTRSSTDASDGRKPALGFAEMTRVPTFLRRDTSPSCCSSASAARTVCLLVP